MDFASQTMMVDLNCRGLTAVTSICLKFMSRGSQIINICSIASFCPNTRLNTYSATKAYVMSFTKGLREELKPLGINCMCVCPGLWKQNSFLSLQSNRVHPRHLTRSHTATLTQLQKILWKHQQRASVYIHTYSCSSSSEFLRKFCLTILWWNGAEYKWKNS